MRRFGLDLFRELQEDYRDRPIVPVARGLDGTALAEAAERRIRSILRHVGPLEGARVLEVGCGRGHVSRLLADEYGCETVGVDIFESDSWAERPDLRFHRHDIASGGNEFLGKFDLIVSFAVWEHVEHPFAALQASRDLLEPSGLKYIYANLYRGPKASHLYRQLWFPWPHLLFQDDVIADYYREDLGQEIPGAAWVNKLTTAQYLTYFDRLGMGVQRLWWSPVAFDQEFYERFQDVLGRYPLFDLERDFIHAVLTPTRPNDAASPSRELRDARRRARALTRERDRARGRIREIETSRSWRVTAPLRTLGQRAGR